MDINESRIKKYIETLRPEDAEIRKKLDYGYSFKNKVFLLYAIRPVWNNPKEIMHSEYAKIRYYNSKNEWNLYWKRASGKWELYEPFPRSTHLEKIIKIIEEDKYGVFMDKLIQKTISEIAENLDCGYLCYLNLKTNDLVVIPNFQEDWDGQEYEELFQDELHKVEQSKADYIKFEQLTSFEYFKIMERFTASLSDSTLRFDLENILQNKKPFQHFKSAMDHSAYREQWFDFKKKEVEKIVENQLQRYIDY